MEQAVRPALPSGFPHFFPRTVRPDAGIAGESLELGELLEAFSRGAAVSSRGCLLPLRANGAVLETSPATPLS
jgi:hypothetical protein